MLPGNRLLPINQRCIPFKQNSPERIGIFDALSSRLAQPIPPPGPPSPTPGAWPSIKSLDDSIGDVWLPYTISLGRGIYVKAGTSISFTISATDPFNRSLQYQVWTGGSPNQRLIRDWGGPTFTWLAAPNPDGGTVSLGVAVKASGSTGRLPNCYRTEPCDDRIYAAYSVSPTCNHPTRFCPEQASDWQFSYEKLALAHCLPLARS